jgi:SSS family solute:Na+ symporter
MMVAIGLYASRKQGSIEDYFVASGRIGTLSIACLWLASWIGGASVVAGASNAYTSGISAGWYIGSMVIGCLVFGLFFAGRVSRVGRENKHLTYPDMMESRYDSRTRVVATITTILAYLGYAAGQIAASALVLQTLLGMEYEVALLVSAGIVVVYTATGGFLAITFTDWVQVSILFLGVVIVGVPVAIANGGSWSALTTSLPASYFDVGGMGWATILAMVVSITLSFFTAMDNYTRCFAAKNAQTMRRGTFANPEHGRFRGRADTLRYRVLSGRPERLAARRHTRRTDVHGRHLHTYGIGKRHAGYLPALRQSVHRTETTA